MPRRKNVAVSTPAPAGISPTIDVVVKQGSRKALEAILPKGSRVLPMAPALPKSLQTPEADFLRRSFQVVLSSEEDAADVMHRLETSDSVESATAGPRLELPR